MSQHFPLSELTVTTTGLDNTPNAEQLKNLEVTALGLEWVRVATGNGPIITTSVFRTSEVNKADKGDPNSGHLLGYCADFIRPGLSNKEICQKIIASGIKFDQLIDELRDGKAWVHISFDPRFRMQYLVFSNGKYEVHA